MSGAAKGSPAFMMIRHLIMLAIAIAIVSPASVRADARSAALERGVKAAFLYKFGDYVEWQPSAFPTADAPFTIGVVGDDALARELASVVTDRTIGSRRVLVTVLAERDSVEGVQMLFVARSASPQMAQIMRDIQQRPVLVVTEWQGALAEGSMINFVLRNARVRFEIALHQAERHGLVLSSRLLGVAHAVVTGTP